jgi:hypothetical protein
MTTMKGARNLHRLMFTIVEEVKVGEDTYIKIRKRLSHYVPFRSWARAQRFKGPYTPKLLSITVNS